MNTKNRTPILAIAAFLLTLALTLVVGYLFNGKSGDDYPYPDGISAETATTKLSSDPLTPADISPEDFDIVAGDACTKASELTDRGPDDTTQTYQDIVDAVSQSIDSHQIDLRTDKPEAVAGSIAGLAISLKCPQYLTVPLI